MAETEDTEHLSEELTAKLLHFQEITHTEDLEECKKILIEHNWDIEKAVQAKFNPPIMHDNNQHQYVAPHSPSMVHHRIPHSLIHHHDLPPRQLVYTNYQSNNSSYLGAVFSLLISPFQFSFSTIFGLIKFIWRLFYPDPRERITDPRGDVISFITEFEEKYPNHPEMFRGTYGDVQSDAKTNLRFLLVYLHDPNNVDSEPFCAGTLCNNNVIQYINETMLFWACSILKPEGYRVSKLIRNPTYPLVAIVCLYQNQLAVVGRIQGKVTPEELISRLQEIVAIYEPVLVAARADRNALTQNQQIREEQDQAYLISLEQDKQKMEEKKREEEKVKSNAERKERLKKEREIAFQLHLDMKDKCKEEICEEPSVDDPDVISLLIKLPCGTRFNRRFNKHHSVKELHDYVYAQDEAPRRYQIFTSFPRSPISGCSTDEVCSSKTLPLLKEAGLNKNDTLFVQSVDDDSTEETSDCDSDR